jgi:hypothetical protein
MKNCAQVDLDLPKMSPMYDCLWTLIASALQGGRHENLEIISNRVGILTTPEGEVSWIHLCYPRKLYNQLKRYYRFPPTLPLYAKLWINEDHSRLALTLNGVVIDRPSIKYDAERSSAINITRDPDCWACGDLLKTQEQLFVNLRYIGSKV